MRITFIALVFSGLIALTHPIGAQAQPCPGDMVNVMGVYAARFDVAPFESSVPACFNMPTAGMVYSGVPFGTMQPANCLIFISPGSSATFSASGFPSNAANNTMNGCDFTCPGNGATCQVRGGTGLPVELLDFAVDDEEQAD